MNVESSLETDAQLAGPCEPCVGSLNHPTIAAEALLALDALADKMCGDTAFSHVIAAARMIVAFVRVQPAGSLPWPSIQPRCRRDCIERAFERYRVVTVRSCDRKGQPDTCRIYDDVTFAADLSSVSRVGPAWPALATLAPHQYWRGSGRSGRARG